MTNKPVMYVANVGEAQLGHEGDDPLVASLAALAKREGAPLITICAELEAQIAALPNADRPAFLAESGLAEPGLNRLVRAGYELLGLITFFTPAPTSAAPGRSRRGPRAPRLPA